MFARFVYALSFCAHEFTVKYETREPRKLLWDTPCMIRLIVTGDYLPFYSQLLDYGGTEVQVIVHK